MTAFAGVYTNRGRSRDNDAIRRKALQGAERGHAGMRAREGSRPVMGCSWVARQVDLGCKGCKRGSV
jgi:hypothetical protein